MSGKSDTQTVAEMAAEIAALKAEIEARKAGHEQPISFRVGLKGAVSVYGMGRFPVTLYAEQWRRLMGKADDLIAFLDANKAILATKGVPYLPTKEQVLAAAAREAARVKAGGQRYQPKA